MLPHPPGCSRPNPWNLWILYGQRDFANAFQLRFWMGGGYPGLSSRLDMITDIPLGGKPIRGMVGDGVMK